MGTLRKHYLANHRSGVVVLAEAEAYRQAAKNPGERVEIVDGQVISVIGEPPHGAIERFAADAALRSERADPLAA